MSDYLEKLKDPRWQKKRLEILEAAGWRCEDCQSDDKELQIHHSIYAKGREPWEYTNNSLMCLCNDCHERRQEVEAACKQWFALTLRFARPEAVEKWRDKLSQIVTRHPGYTKE